MEDAGVEISAEKGQVIGCYKANKVILNHPAQEEGNGDSLTPVLSPQSGMTIDQSLRSSINVLFARFVNLEENSVDYQGLKNSSEWAEYEKQARRLSGQSKEVQELLATLPGDANQRKAFFLNLYNSMVIHGKIVLGTPSTLLQRLYFYATTSYNVGGLILSLNDIENGILRANRPSAVPFAKPQFNFSQTSEKTEFTRSLVLQDVDPRIHFALNCGAKSCPPIRFYDPTKLDQQLDKATRGFMKANTKVIQSKNDNTIVITLSKLLDYYKGDFGQNNIDILKWICQYAKEEQKEKIQNNILSTFQKSDSNFEFKYSEYDWSSNSL